MLGGNLQDGFGFPVGPPLKPSPSGCPESKRASSKKKATPHLHPLLFFDDRPAGFRTYREERVAAVGGPQGLPGPQGTGSQGRRTNWLGALCGEPPGEGVHPWSWGSPGRGAGEVFPPSWEVGPFRLLGSQKGVPRKEEKEVARELGASLCPE